VRPDPTRRAARRLAYIGNFVSRHTGTQPYCELLTTRLGDAGWTVVRASSERSRVRRWLSMLRAAAGTSPGLPVVIDVFSTAAFLWAESTALVAARRGARVVLVLRGGALPLRAGRSPGRMCRLFGRAAAVITPSQFLQERLGPLAPTGIRYIPNAVDLGRYVFRERRVAAPRIAWLRRLAREYLPGVAVRATALVRERAPAVRLFLGGPDSNDGTGAELKTLVRALGIQEAVEFTGSIPKENVPAFLQRGDIFLNTTRFESFGVSVMEAAACGLCIVTTDVGELSYLWSDGEDALLLPPDDPGATAAAISRILEDPPLASQLSRAARRKAEAYDWAAVLPLWERLLEEVSAGA